jgi:hypothetical protein
MRGIEEEIREALPDAGCDEIIDHTTYAHATQELSGKTRQHMIPQTYDAPPDS